MGGIIGWAKLTLIAFCLVEVGVLGVTRTLSGLGHLHALQEVSDDSASTAAAACSEAVAAMDDFGPVIPLLNVGRILPFAAAQAFGQVPHLASLGRATCPSVELYASLAPWPYRTIQDGVLADVLENVQTNRSQLQAANAQIADAWTQLDAMNLDTLAADARLARAARVMGTARQQQADISDGLAFMAPEHLEGMLASGSPRSVILRVADSNPAVQAYATLQNGRVVSLAMGTPAEPPLAIIWVDQTGLQRLRDSLTHAEIPPGAADDVVAEALLAEFVRQPLADDQNLIPVLKRSADDHHTWLWFADPALQSLVARRDWTRQ